LLLADDSVTIQRVIELTFADEDVQVVAVSDGDQAIERLESAPPDIVLADVGMPGRNGYEVAQYIKQSPRLSHIPVVLLTGAFEPIDQVRAAEVGCDGVLAKPFEPQLVIGRVKELLTGQGKKRAPASPASTPPPSSAPPPIQPPIAADLDDYFERLDVAFSSLQNSPAPPPGGFASTLPEPPTGNEIEYFASEHAPPPMTEAAADAPHEAIEVPPAPPPPAPAPPPAPVRSEAAEPPRDAHAELPSIGDAFAAILSAEQQVAQPSARPLWPASAARTANAGAAISDDLVERVVREVLDRLSDRIVREQVAQIVSGVAERLVRQEIERIKASIK
jgi:CheY-like chemotaxis protein